ncbi:hypothetical protein, partial [Mesorhizobium sp. M7A.F.Ca.CA.004.11.2.1]|uniref:hypothetical protein n=1 Tax=Mesorhizobium sp. M7A.F.Ca.CA.004.11.2.1 TaxID=2496699 RepID=UPI0019D0FA0F
KHGAGALGQIGDFRSRHLSRSTFCPENPIGRAQNHQHDSKAHACSPECLIAGQFGNFRKQDLKPKVERSGKCANRTGYTSVGDHGFSLVSVWR